jgi:outer membrane murein-binding lipoprotein Lpp
MLRITILISAAILAGCASTPMSDRASRIQVHSQYSTLLAKCENLGPVTASAQGAGTMDEGFSAAKIKLREVAADKGADTVVIVNSDRFMHSLYNREQVIQGAALRCY